MADARLAYAVVTFGCRVNQADTLALEAGLQERGAVPAPLESADVVVVNTCSVTAGADQGARQTIRRLVRDNPSVRVVVTGCYATRRPQELAALPGVVQVVRNDDKDALASWILPAAGAEAGDGPCGRVPGPGLGGRTSLTLRVQTGCDQTCSYCIIPRTRGAGRSRPLPAVRHAVEQAVAAGYREVVITGVHLGSYGRDLADGTSLHALLGLLADWPAEVLFRVSSLEPMDCTDAIVDLMAASPRLAPHFHLPLQHGADAMLRAMRRPYAVRDYERLVHRVRARLPHAAIGSDVIVGFPGETDGMFEEMCRRLEALPLTHLHVFPYSDRPGTEASALQPKVDGRATRARAARVRAIGAAHAAAFRASLAGSRRPALVVDDGWSAVTDNYLKVRLSRQAPRNTWVEVTVD